MNPLIAYTKWLFKWMAISVVGIGGLIGGGIVADERWDWWTYKRHVEKIALTVRQRNQWGPATSSKIANKLPGVFDDLPVVRWSDDDPPCKTEEFPVFIGFVNRSDKTIKEISIEVEGTFPNHSTNILNSAYTHISMDRIVPPGGG